MNRYQIFREAYEALCYQYNLRIKGTYYMEGGGYAPADYYEIVDAEDDDIEHHIEENFSNV